MKAKLLILTIAYPGVWEVLFHFELCNVLHTLAEHGIDFKYHTLCSVPSQYNMLRDFHHSECRGDLTVYSTSSRIVQRTLDWGRHRAWSFAPFTVLDVGNPSYWDALLPVFVEVMTDRVACVAFPAEAAAEMRDERATLDDPGNDAMQVPLDEDLSKAIDREKDLLDAMPLPGSPVDEAERRRAWITLPLRVRTAIRRMHRQFGHTSSTVLVQILRAARAPPEYIQACRHFRCDACEDNKPKHQSTKVALPKHYVFGRNLGIDVLEVKDIADETYLCLNILDLGTTFQQVVLMRQGHGSPSSRECLDSFVSLWVGWAGWPQTLSCDRGVHNRGVFARTLAQHGVLIRQAGVESPEQIVLKRMVIEHAVQGFDDIKIAIAEAVSTKNNLSRNGGFSPSQWVFGTLPRGPGDQFDEQEFADLGPLQGQLEPGTAFARRAEHGASARRGFIREDCGRRVARAVLRKAAPLVGEYATGDVVCYRKEDQGWSPACRLKGFDGNKTAWLPCVQLSTDCDPRLQLKRSPCSLHKT